MIYMLNFVFDTSDGTESNDARFKEYDQTQPLLLQSKVWLKQAAANNPSPNPDTATDWVFLQEDDGPAVTLGNGDIVWIRYWGLNVSGYVARQTAICARNAKRATRVGNNKPTQMRASPFPLGTTQQSCALFDTMNPLFQSPGTGGSWVMSLGVVTFITTPPTAPPPVPANFHDSYSLVVALTVGQGQAGNNAPSGAITYAHDPEFDVDSQG
jgi:hypothetical protein